MKGAYWQEDKTDCGCLMPDGILVTRFSRRREAPLRLEESALF